MATVENIKVLIRIRPNLDVDAKNYLSKYKESNSIIIPSEFERKTFSFDNVADENTTQEEIFQCCKSIFQSFFAGYNCTIFAYGQTSSGKTFTMTGDNNEDNINKDPGLVPRGLQYIFDKINENSQTENVEYLVKCSFVEIYNEKLFDLLDPKGQRVYLKVNLSQGVYVDKLTEKVIPNTRDALAILEKGLANRHVASTAMNRSSSRSHAVFSVILESCVKEGDIENIRKSVLHLVDLAGSERQRDTKSDGTRLKEAGSINKSLHVLGQVISSHVDISNGKKRYIRYRDSKLTQLLKDSIGGNAKTFLVACVHPDIKYTSETLSTLQFASHVKMIKNKAKVNIDVFGNVESLQKEVLLLREQLQSRTVHHTIPLSDVDLDSVWKKRFIQAMALRASSSNEICQLAEQLAVSTDSNTKLEGIICNLKNECQIKDSQIQRLERRAINVSNDENQLKQLVDCALLSIKLDVEKNIDRVKLDSYQIEVANLRGQLQKSKNMESLTISQSTLVESLFNEFNELVISGQIDAVMNATNSGHIECSKLQESLSECHIVISQLNRKIKTLNITRQEERRKWESEIASLKSIIKNNNYENEQIAVNRRKTLFNFIKQKPISPIRNAPGINTARRHTNMQPLIEKEETNDFFEEFQASEEWEIETLTNDLKEAQEKNSKYQRMVGKFEYDIKEYRKDIDELKNSLKDHENLEINFNDLKEKYNATAINLQERMEVVKQLEGQIKKLNIEKDKSTKYLNEKIQTLEVELEEVLLERNSFKDELEVVTDSFELLKDEFKRKSDFFLICKMNVNEIQEYPKINDVSKEEIMTKLKEELCEANDKIESLKSEKSGWQVEISDLEKAVLERDEEIEELENKLTAERQDKCQQMNDLSEKYNTEIDNLKMRLVEDEVTKTKITEELNLIKIELDQAIVELESLKSSQSSQITNYTTIEPVDTSSPISKNKSQNDKYSLLEELLSTSEKLENELKNEKMKLKDIETILENICKISNLPLELSILDTMKNLEAKVLCYEKDIKDCSEFLSINRTMIATKDNYIYDLTVQLKSANKQRQDLKMHNDELIKSYGHSNYKQKIKMLSKLKDDLFQSRDENLILTDRFNRIKMFVNKCEPGVKNFILNGAKENADPEQYHL